MTDIHENLTIPVQEATLAACLYRPLRTNKRLPIIIMSHGFSALKEHGLHKFAKYFSDEGFAVLLYDQRNFGGSTGTFRHHIDPQQQCNDLCDVLDTARMMLNIDAQRIGLWGTSYSGGHVLNVAQQQPDIACVVAQVPFLSGSFNATGQCAQQETVRLSKGHMTTEVCVVSNDTNMRSVIPGQRAWDFFHSIPHWHNGVTLASIKLAAHYEPHTKIASITDTPVQMIIADDDHVNQCALQKDMFERLNTEKECVTLHGDHFCPYDTQFKDAASAALRWFCTHLMNEKQ